MHIEQCQRMPGESAALITEESGLYGSFAEHPFPRRGFAPSSVARRRLIWQRSRSVVNS